MSKLTNLIITILFFTSFTIAQNKLDGKKVKISGIILEKGTDLPLEYATVVFQNTKNPEVLTGGVTDFEGKFNFEVQSGTYNIRFEFISFKTIELKNQIITANKNFGNTYLQADIAQLAGVELVAEKSTVEIKLDKRIYNVGKDMIVKGGTMSDVLNNVPSVTVDPDGSVALRGNENVRILIDGKPSGLFAANITDALKILPADAVEKIEVITNPSARYDAEGSGGIINIVLKKGKAQGLNGSFIVSAGNPKSYGASASLNYRDENFNLFSNFGYNYRTSLGKSLTNSEYLNSNGTTRNYINEKRNNEQLDDGYNANFGADWFLTKSLSWTNALTFRNSDKKNPDNVFLYNFDEFKNPTFTRNRFNNQYGDDFSLLYSSYFTKNFKKEGHNLTINLSFAKNNGNDYATIEDQIINNPSSLYTERTTNNNKQLTNLFQADYVLPIGKNGRFEAGYRGNFQKNITNFTIDSLNNGNWVKNDYYSNLLEYKENINALYVQYGNKINTFSYFLGLRFEDSNIDVNSVTSSNYNNKKYNIFFPTATVSYEFSETSNFSLSYSKRVNRPRGRFLNPFSTYSSNINIFRGNPNLNPAYTNAIELGYLKKWNKITFNTSAYVNLTDASFQFIRRESGNFNISEVNGIEVKTPIIESTPINLAKEYRAGFEFNINYNPYKWWRLNSNFNLFRNETKGNYSYVNYLGNTVSQNFDNVATTWFARLTSKITLPYKIDWQTNAMYRAPQSTAQGKRLSMTNVNLAFSKDILKDKGTVALNVSDLFNSGKRRSETYLSNSLNSYSEFQRRQRQITLSFTYRFNKNKNDKRKDNKNGSREGESDEGDFME